MLLVLNQKGFEKWWYALPDFTLRSRNQTKWFDLADENQKLDAVASFVAYSVVLLTEEAEENKKFTAEIYDYDRKIAQIEFAETAREVEKPQINEKIFALSSTDENAVVFVRLYAIPQTLIAEFIIEKSENCRFKLDEKSLTVTDDGGRVIIFDHRERILRRNFRV